MKLPASQFYWADWLRDPAVRACGLDERGLWIDMLALMHAGEPRGHLTVGGVAPTDAELARMVGTTPPTIRRLLASLERKAVFSRTDAGVVYSRRMVRDEHIRQVRAAAGKMGGNPALLDKPEDKQMDKQMVNLAAKQVPTPSVAVAVASSPALQTTHYNNLPATPKPPASRPKGRAEKKPRATWLTPFGTVWEATNGKGSFPWGQAASELKPLRDAGLSDAVIAGRLAWYLRVKGLEHPDPTPDMLERRAFTPSLRDFRLRHGKFSAGDPPPTPDTEAAA